MGKVAYPTCTTVMKMSDRSGVAFVGKKMPMDCVQAIITGLSGSKANEITLKARGQFNKPQLSMWLR